MNKTDNFAIPALCFLIISTTFFFSSKIQDDFFTEHGIPNVQLIIGAITVTCDTSPRMHISDPETGEVVSVCIEDPNIKSDEWRIEN